MSTNWIIAEQVGKFYLKDFCRLLRKHYKHQKIVLFLASSVGERFRKPTCFDLDKCITHLMTDFDYMVYLKDIFAVTAIERNSDIYIYTREKDYAWLCKTIHYAKLDINISNRKGLFMYCTFSETTL